MDTRKTDGLALARYFEGTSYVGSRQIYCCGYSDAGGAVHSAHWPHTAYFCPQCGELWGRQILDHQFTYAPIPLSHWVIEPRPCAPCGDGQFLYSQPLDLVDSALLTRELLVLLERNHNDN